MNDELRDRILASYPAVLIRRFFDLELLDRAFGLAAQAFVAILPLVIVAISVLFSDGGEVIASSISDRFGLAGTARNALSALFTASTSHERTIYWVALIFSFLSAFSLSRRLSRVYASIFGVPRLRRSQTWRGLIWIVVQVLLLIAASWLRDLRIGAGLGLTVLAVAGLLVVWFAADVAGLRLLVPTVGMRLIAASAIVSGIGRLGIAVWAAVYMPRSLESQAQQYGPIGVTFAIFTYLLAGVLVYICAPLIVTTWISWREGTPAPESPAE